MRDARFTPDAPGRVGVVWNPEEYDADHVVVERDGELVSIHNNGNNYVLGATPEDEHELVPGGAHLLNQPPGAHNYRLLEWVKDPDSGEYVPGRGSGIVSALVE